MATLTLTVLSDLADFNQSSKTKLSNNNNNNNNSSTAVDPKAVGGHRPLSRRRSNPPNNTSNNTSNNNNNNNKMPNDLLLNSAESLALLTSHFDDGSADSATKRHRKLDRSQSEPVDRAASSASNPSPGGLSNSSSRYKTELCRPFEENGTCKYGDKCQFAHGFNELRSLVRHPKYKTELCRTYHTIGFCPYGPRCHFIHNAEEARQGGTISTSCNKRNKKLSLSLAPGGSSTADSPSPPSSLSDSPTSTSACFFGDDLLFGHNPFSPLSTVAASSLSAANFLFGSDFVSPLLARCGSSSSSSSSHSGSDALAQQYSALAAGWNQQQVAPVSPVDSLASDLDSLSLSSASPPPPSESSSLASARHLLRLPIFSRISETTNED